jgi:DNA topoisomerase II
MNMIKVDIDPEMNMISVWNNGKGIPIEIHKEHNCYVPEMIFGKCIFAIFSAQSDQFEFAGQLLTSSNYDDKQKKVTGGRNGFGAKLANIFSTEFIIETGSAEKRVTYRQVFRKNMSKKEEPDIRDSGKDTQDFTCIKFKPDLTKFKMTHLDDDIVSLLTKRVYDIAGVSDRRVRVKLNGRSIEIRDF